jgi:hypothetical protein
MHTEANTAAAKRTPRSLDDFHIVDAKAASWVCLKVNEARAYQARIKNWAERELRRARRREAFFLARFSRELEEWARVELAKPEHRKRKVINLPGGTIGFRRTVPRLVIQDEAKLLAWCKQHLPAAVKTVESIVKTPLNEHVAATGEIANGAELTGGGETFYVR